jgi:4-hydroxybenzoyl-CoA reductase subunit beta
MMRLPEFECLRPRTLAEAVSLLGSESGAVTLVAGGTDLYPNMKRRQAQPQKLISLRGIAEMRQIRDREPGLAIGAGTTLRELIDDRRVQADYPALSQAAALISSPQIRNMGTVGGNLCVDTRCLFYNQAEDWRESIGFCLKAGSGTCRLAPGGSRCWAVSSSDLAPVLISLNASARLLGGDGERVIPLEHFYADSGAEWLARRPDEILVEILLPPKTGVRAAYRKLRRRRSIDFPLLGVAAAVRLDDDGKCVDARIVIGAVASYPVRLNAVEELLTGRPLTPEVIEEAAEAAARTVKPMDNADLTPLYRKRMTAVFLRRALSDLADGREGATG